MSPSKTKRRGAGDGGLYQDSRGLWTAVVELPSTAGKRRRKVIRAADRAVAQRKLRELRRELDRAGDLPTSSPTVQQWLTTWLDRVAAPRLKPRTLHTYRGYVTRYIIPSIGRIRLDRLTADHVRRMHAHITDQGLSTTTALQAHRILAKALTDAMREGKVGRNVADREHIDAPTRALAVRPALTAEQAGALLRSVNTDRYGAARWGLALLAGLRQGEALGLTTDALDLSTGTLEVSWQLQRLPWAHGCHKPGKAPVCARRAASCPDRTVRIPPDQETTQVDGGLWLTRPKSRAGWRQVPLAGGLGNVLATYLADVGPGMAGLLLHRASGRPVDPSDDAVAWDAALRAVGLPDVPLHSARHTCSTLLYALGVPEQTRMAILGHSSATVTRGYTHITDREARDAMDRLGTLLYGREIEG